jgi:flagellar motor switch protein FliG
MALQGEHPQAVALVLAELPPKRSTEILSRLSEEQRFKTVKRMTNPEYVSADAKVRIANVLLKKLEVPAVPGAPVAAAVVAASGPSAEEQSKAALRRLAVMLRGLAKELRDGLVESIKQGNEEAAASVMQLMILWEDIVLIADRPLQEALRGLESQKLAKALIKSDPAVAQKIRANISERARGLLDEETELLGTPKADDIAAAREEFVNTLREINAKGELTFIEE